MLNPKGDRDAIEKLGSNFSQKPATARNVPNVWPWTASEDTTYGHLAAVSVRNAGSFSSGHMVRNAGYGVFWKDLRAPYGRFLLERPGTNC